MSGYCKYYKQKKQVSYDSGTTWVDVSPAEYKKGYLYEVDSIDCGFIPPSGHYLTFVAKESGTFKFSGNSIDYSLDSGSTWTTLASDTYSPTVQSGSTIMWKASGLTPTSSIGIGTFSSTGRFSVEGNAMSLLYGDNFSGQTSLSGYNYALSNLFSGCTGLTSAENLSLPATTLADWCYNQMFRECTSLTSAPELPATTLSQYCYYKMFLGCTSLTTAPELPATTVDGHCYYYMFYNCSSLIVAPELPATTLAEGCYAYMFYGCTSLAVAPELPATTLAEGCYSLMFYGCTSLTSAPELPATTLAEGCYSLMFYGCTSLTISPTLSASTLVKNCYMLMFTNCESLSIIRCYATDISAEGCTSTWVLGVATNGTFEKLMGMNDWSRDSSGIPSGWVVASKPT